MKKAILLILAAAFLFTSFILLSATDRGTGVIPASEKELAIVQFAEAPYISEPLPNVLDLSNKIPKPGDQGKLNSSVGWALGYALKSYQEAIEADISFYTPSGKLIKSAIFSPSFIYNQLGRGRDEGASIPSGLKFIKRKGAGLWVDFPYDSTNAVARPDSNAVARALSFKISTYKRMNPGQIDHLKGYLSCGYPIIVSVGVNNSFKSLKCEESSACYYAPLAGFEALWFQAMVIVGYDDFKKAFKLQNSYGQEWGQGGYCWVKYSQVHEIIKEAYIVKDMDNDFAEVEKLESISFKILNTKEIKDEQRRDTDPVTGKLSFTGSFAIPKHIGKSFRIVIRVYERDETGQKGDKVLSLEPQFAAADTSMVIATKVYDIGENGIKNTWWVDIPLSAFKLSKGQADMWGNYTSHKNKFLAEPSLYVDQFAVSKGNQITFMLER